jgi:formate dehydrogenase subunit delta
MSPEKLAYMANQIGHAFAHQTRERAVDAIADHIRKFWDPRMRSAIIAYMEAGGGTLDPLPREAVMRIGREHAAAP